LTKAASTDTAADQNVIVVLAASEEATCPGDDCKFSFVAPGATVTSLTPAFNATTNTLEVTLAGTGLPDGNTAGLTLHLAGVAQTTTSVTATAAVFTVTDVKVPAFTDANVYFADGLATGYASINALTLTPAFVSLSPNSGGSEGGTLVTVTGTGFGTDTKDVQLFHNSLDLCKTVTITGYGSFTCLTKAVAVTATDKI